jgi:hypothetical protein
MDCEKLEVQQTEATTALPVVWTSEQWVAYFRENAEQLLTVPWEADACLTSEERALVAASLPAWQLGETSDGSHLFNAACRYAELTGDTAFVDAVKLFIAEEHRHGSHLGRFLDLAGIPRRTWYWGDALFRVFRRLFSRIEISASVVVMVEIHALLYYAAIRRATGSPVLRRVCQQILADEIPHIRFQCERLASIRRRRSWLLQAMTLGVQQMFFTGLTCAIWLGHRKALRAGGFTFRRFWRTAWAKMGRAWQRMNPKAYQWPAAASTARGARSILDF